MFKIFLCSIVFIIVVCFLTFIANGGDLANYSFFAPKYESVRYRTFKQSQAFNDGMIKQLRQYQLQYTNHTTTELEKSTIKATVQHQFGAFDSDNLPSDLAGFFQQMMQN